MDIDWTNSDCQVTEHFTVKDCLLLHAWNELATENDGADFEKLTTLCNKLEEIRNILGCPMIVTSMYRSPEYNQHQGIVPIHDVHSMNIAADFQGDSLSIQDIKDKLEPLLEQLNIRMEKGTTTWCHVDLREPGPSGRYFTP